MLINRFTQTILIAIIVFIGLEASAKKYPKPIQKRIDKAVKVAFDTADVSFEDLNNGVDNLDSYSGIEKIAISKLSMEGNTIGFAAFASTKGKNDLFDYMVLFDELLYIKKVIILVYRSSYGGEIMAKYWLKQLEGKSNGEQMQFEKDIDSISGATISAPAITTGIKSLSLLMVNLKESGKL